ncbi:MAG: hypothetical protein SFU83_10525 [Meiothermus sp.]|nr:hypothetical protein [Meiothermus sp.]
MPYSYCQLPPERGLSCAPEGLQLLHRLSQDLRPDSRQVIRAYRCTVCGGLYKYIYASHQHSRNFDDEAGMVVYEDHYYKVDERNALGQVKFSPLEASAYGYQGPDLE